MVDFVTLVSTGAKADAATGGSASRSFANALGSSFLSSQIGKRANSFLQRISDNPDADTGVARPGEPADAPTSTNPTGQASPGEGALKAAQDFFKGVGEGFKIFPRNVATETGDKGNAAPIADAFTRFAFIGIGAAFVLFGAGALVLSSGSLASAFDRFREEWARSSLITTNRAARRAISGEGLPVNLSRKARPAPPSDGPQQSEGGNGGGKPSDGGEWKIIEQGPAPAKYGEDEPRPFFTGNPEPPPQAKPPRVRTRKYSAFPSGKNSANADPLDNIPLGKDGNVLAENARRKGVPESRILKPGDKPPNQRK